MTDLLATFDNAKYFSSLDLTMGYHQIRLASSTSYLTSFIINGEQYEYTRLPFGLINAPLYFQKVMNKLLRHKKFIKVYLDDLLIFSKTEEQHIEDIKTVINLLHQNNISINFTKSFFFKTIIKFLGNIISSEGISPDTSRISNLESKINIKSRKELQSLLGFINWFRPYIKDLSNKLSLITDKLKLSKFSWSNEDAATIQSIITEIKSGVLLHFPNYEYSFELFTDASDLGLGAVLKQGKFIIGFFSYKLKGSELNYTIMEKEAYAILKAVNHFRTILSNAYVRIFTDNANTIFNSENISKRVYRWKILLSEYNYTLEFIKGKENNAADFLSRLYLFKPSKSLNVEVMQTWQAQDAHIKNLKDPVIHTIKEGVSLVTDKMNRIIIPNINFKEFFIYYHEILAHPGYRKFYSTFKRFFISSNF